MQNEEYLDAQVAESELSANRRNFIAGLWHGAFLALAMALTEPTTVISAFVADLTGSTIWVGGLSTVLVMAGTLPQIFVARWIEPKPRKLPYLIAAISLRVISWGTLAWLIFTIGDKHPTHLAWVLVGMLTIFYAGGGIANIPYTDIIGKVIPAGKRGAFFGGRSALAGPLSIGSAFAATQILAKVAYPNNYALLFGLAAAGLAIASLGFWAMKEPISTTVKNIVLPWHEYWHQLVFASRKIKTLIAVQLLTGFSLMSMPFYVVFARENLHAPDEAVGWFLLVQVLGGTITSLFWARLVDRAGSKRMLFYCALISTSIPLLAIALSSFGWVGLLPVFFLVGTVLNGRNVGFQSALLELAPEEQRSSYAGLNAVLTLPIAFLSLAAGYFLQHWCYTTLFLVTAIFVGTGAAMIYRWAKKEKNLL
jgi:MFS family permease